MITHDCTRVAHRRGPAIALTPLLLLASTLNASAQDGRQDAIIVLTIMSVCFFVLFAAIGGWFYYTARKYQALAEASSHWPTVTGKVLKSEVIRRGGKSSTYEPRVQYEYGVAGVRHEGGVIELGMMRQATTAAAEKLIAPYPVGTNVTVHYNPDDPKTATLETTASSVKGRMMAAVGIPLVGVVVWGIVVWIIVATA